MSNNDCGLHVHGVSTTVASSCPVFRGLLSLRETLRIQKQVLNEGWSYLWGSLPLDHTTFPVPSHVTSLTWTFDAICDAYPIDPLSTRHACILFCGTCYLCMEQASVRAAAFHSARGNAGTRWSGRLGWLREEGNFNWSTIVVWSMLCVVAAATWGNILSFWMFPLKKGLLPARPTIKGLSKLGWDSHNKKLAQGGTEEGAFMKLNSAITLPFLWRTEHWLKVNAHGVLQTFGMEQADAVQQPGTDVIASRPVTGWWDLQGISKRWSPDCVKISTGNI